MTVSSMPGVLSFTPQVEKETYVAGDSSNWYRHYVTRTDIGAQQVVQQFPAEVGAGFHPTGAFKSMAFGGGMATLHPRLEDVFGWILYAGVGQHAVNSTQVESGVYRHLFYPPDDFCDMGWMQFRKFVPGECGVSNENLGEMVQDGRVLNLQFTLAPAAILSSQLAVVGRIPKFWVGTASDAANNWAADEAYANAFEEYTSVPLTHKGSVVIGGTRTFSTSSIESTSGGTEEKCTAVQISLVNQYTRPQEEMIVGSPYPDDFVLTRQVLTINWTYKWQNNDLYLQLMAKEAGITHDGLIDWSEEVHTDSIDVAIESPADISGRSVPYLLRMFAPVCTWQAQGPPELIGGGWLSLQMQGVAQAQSGAGTDTFWFELENEVADYSWPTS